MLERLGGEHAHYGSRAYAVVGPKGGAARPHPFAVDVGIYGILLKIVGGFAILLRHHIQVGLQHYRFAVLHAGGGWLTDYNVSGMIYGGFQPQFLAELPYEFCYFRLVLTGAWNLR